MSKEVHCVIGSIGSSRVMTNFSDIKIMQEEQLSIFLHDIQYKLKILAAAFNVDSYQPMKQFVMKALYKYSRDRCNQKVFF